MSGYLNVSYRATRATQLDTPSKVPVSLTQSLSVLRLDHARLLEEHGANVALLRTREAEIAALQDHESENRETIETLQGEQRMLKDKLTRLEHGTKLAEREVGFLKSLNVSVCNLFHTNCYSSVCRRVM